MCDVLCAIVMVACVATYGLYAFVVCVFDCIVDVVGCLVCCGGVSVLYEDYEY